MNFIPTGPQRSFRRRRFSLFLNLVDEVLSTQETCRILDIGGAPGYWTDTEDILGGRRRHVTLVNLTKFPVEESRFTSVAGDARNLSSYADMSFDLAHSNSVIEHVGSWGDMKAMAREVRNSRLATSFRRLISGFRSSPTIPHSPFTGCRNPFASPCSCAGPAGVGARLPTSIRRCGRYKARSCSTGECSQRSSPTPRFIGNGYSGSPNR